MKFKNPFSSTTAMSEEKENISTEENNTVSASGETESKQEPDTEANDPLESLKKELSETKDQHLRLFAEFDNYKRRTARERLELMKTAGEDIITSLLPVLDDFDRALKAMGNNENNPARDGVILIHNKLSSLLSHRGLKAMNALGKEFDVELHEAITNIPVEDAAMKGKVVDEVEKGYWLNDKVIRYAKVVVGQ